MTKVLLQYFLRELPELRGATFVELKPSVNRVVKLQQTRTMKPTLVVGQAKRADSRRHSEADKILTIPIAQSRKQSHLSPSKDGRILMT